MQSIFLVQIIIDILFYDFCMIELVQTHCIFPSITFQTNLNVTEQCLYVSKESTYYITDHF